MAKYLDYAGLQRLTSKIKELFVQKESGKGLSTNDYTTVEKNKLAGLKTYTNATETEAGLMSSADKAKIDGVQAGAEANVITQIKKNGTIVSPSDKTVDISVPIKLSELTNDKTFQTKTEVQALISAASHMKKEIVAELPTTGTDNVIYLKGPSGTGNNIYEEYLYINSKWEKIGDTSTTVDLSGYLKKVDIEAITNSEIDTAIGG